MLFLVCNSSQVENHLDFAEQEHSRSGQSTAAPRETLRALALMTAFTLLSTLLISAVRPRQRQKLWKRASCAGVASATHHPANARTQPLAAAARTALIKENDDATGLVPNNIAPDNVFTTPFRRFRTKVNKVEGKTTYSDGFSLDPNILGLVILSSALGVAIAK